ncbi:hypothetical protein FRACYDRAFT_238318 [Fragilariopsis cylindrus CCMP1102]|uniref:Uncharacterized protein n=1 Tax=Fragilariopsis cylindrus CCMP1102 TaxID=635003 RepID=A0A1E7FIA4_9STRA|nr:hypothetical protein FRACYDRAFT_238318 [Fragilariopsis cylindrus CCMP1102]|eukprot:OEU17888.1 hypothetical protein FRACYDRAFT_238318 [Fragilariopsis cylindrus CCMP1102]
MPKPAASASPPNPPLPRTRKDAQGQKKCDLITGWMNSNISKGHDIQVPESKGSYTEWNDPKNAVTILQVGSAPGCNGSHILLVEGKSIQYKALKDIVKNFGCPPGSCVIPTRTDDAWEEVVLPHLIEGIRQMPVICNYFEFN